MATNGVKSNIPVLGIMRRSGDKIGSVILSRIMVSLFGLGENQDRITRAIITKVSTLHRTMIMSNKSDTTPNFPISWLYYRQRSLPA